MGPDTLAEQIQHAVWAALWKRRWFGKHVEDDEIDALWEEIGDVITAAIKERIG